MNQNYYVCSVGAPKKDYSKENLKRCIDNVCFTLHKENKQKGCIKDININDILILKYDGHFIGYGRANGSFKINEKNFSDDGWNWIIPVDMWVIGSKTHIYGIKKSQEGGTPYSTVRKVKRDFALDKIKEMNRPIL